MLLSIAIIVITVVIVILLIIAIIVIIVIPVITVIIVINVIFVVCYLAFVIGYCYCYCHRCYGQIFATFVANSVVILWFGSAGCGVSSSHDRKQCGPSCTSMRRRSISAFKPFPKNDVWPFAQSPNNLRDSCFYKLGVHFLGVFVMKALLIWCLY